MVQHTQPEIAELVDDDRGVGHGTRCEQPMQECGLAAAEKAGEQEDRDGSAGEDVLKGHVRQLRVFV